MWNINIFPRFVILTPLLCHKPIIGQRLFFHNIDVLVHFYFRLFLQFCNCRPLPFGVRGQNGIGVLFTTEALDEPKLYRLTIQAQSFTGSHRLGNSEFVIYISISSYPY